MRGVGNSGGAVLLALAIAGLMAPVGRADAGRAEARPSCLGDRATIVGTAGDDVLRGTPGDDVIQARGGDDVVIGGGGVDVVCSARGADRVRDAWSVFAGPGDDVVRVAAEADGSSAFGGAGDDLLVGSSGTDYVWGSSPGPGIGGNPVPAGDDDDRIITGPGDDRVFGAAGSDVVRTGAGRDVVEVEETATGIDLRLGADRDEATVLIQASSRISLVGGDGLDLLHLYLRSSTDARGSGQADLLAGIFTAGGPPGAFGGWEYAGLNGPLDWAIVGTEGPDTFLVNGGSVRASMGAEDDLITVFNDGPRADYVDGGAGQDYADLGEHEGDQCVDVETGDCAPRG